MRKFVYSLTLLMVTSCMNMPSEKNDKWLGTMAKYEGFPLALRVNVTAETESNKGKYSQLVVITQELDKVKPNGLPESIYNESLFDLDIEIVSLFDKDNQGMTALVETYAGKRNYYMYTTLEAPVEVSFNKLQSKYPQYKFLLFKKSDKKWSLLSNYKKDFPW